MAWTAAQHARAILFALFAGIVVNAALLVPDRGHDPVAEHALPGGGEPVVAAGERIVALADDGLRQRLVVMVDGVSSVVDEFSPEVPALLVSDGRAYAFAAYNASSGRSRIAAFGDPEVQAEIPGAPRALAVRGGEAAVAVEGEDAARWLREKEEIRVEVGSPVNAVALSEGLIAIGTSGGRIELRGSRNASLSTGYALTSLAFSDDGGSLVAGGRTGEQGQAPGRVFLFDLQDPAFRTPRWESPAGGPVTIVALSPDGALVLALVEVPARGEAIAFHGGTGAVLWRYVPGGSVFHVGIGGQGSLALSADGARVAVASLESDIALLDASGRELWKSGARGASSLSFGEGFLAASARLGKSRDYDTVVQLDLASEPLVRNAAVTVPAATGAIAASLALWVWERRDRGGT